MDRCVQVDDGLLVRTISSMVCLLEVLPRDSLKLPSEARIGTLEERVTVGEANSNKKRE